MIGVFVLFFYYFSSVVSSVFPVMFFLFGAKKLGSEMSENNLLVIANLGPTQNWVGWCGNDYWTLSNICPPYQTTPTPI